MPFFKSVREFFLNKKIIGLDWIFCKEENVGIILCRTGNPDTIIPGNEKRRWLEVIRSGARACQIEFSIKYTDS